MERLAGLPRRSQELEEEMGLSGTPVNDTLPDLEVAPVEEEPPQGVGRK